MIAYRAAWEITRNPAVRILYISSTSNLANKQLKFIKDILLSDKYRFYWPDMVLPDEGKREKWTETEISVDHPKRKAEFIRDPTVFTAGLTTAIVGMHCDIAIMDDVVTSQNGLTEEGREKTESQYSLLASIESSDACEWIVGTRYHPKDLYGTLLEKKVSVFNEEGELVAEDDLYEVFEKQVESIGDGTGEFLWPRQQRKDGKWFGFNKAILATKKAQYLDQVQFRAQYYNDPNSAEGNSIPRDCFQYYDRSFLTRSGSYWHFKGKRLNVFAAMDFAYTIRAKSDYSAIVVVGVDEAHNYYVLDIDRFKTNIISEYFDHLLRLHQKWDFRKIRAEVTAAQSVIVEDLKVNYIRRHGLALSIDEFKPNRYLGAKEERLAAILQPRYANRQIWHYLGGNCQTLEEELMQAHPSHDDVKDALATAVDACIAPAAQNYSPMMSQTNAYTHSRFGGFA